LLLGHQNPGCGQMKKKLRGRKTEVCVNLVPAQRNRGHINVKYTDVLFRVIWDRKLAPVRIVIRWKAIEGVCV